jgi:hypothetical protein
LAIKTVELNVWQTLATKTEFCNKVHCAST